MYLRSKMKICKTKKKTT